MPKLIYFVRWLWIIAISVVLFFNLRLYAPSPLARTDNQLPPGIVLQLNASRRALETDAPSKMQQLFPEGYFFSFALFGLTWIETALRDPTYSQQAIDEAKWAMEHLESKEGKSPFPPQLPPNHGMFYSAWTCHLQAGIVMIQNGGDSAELAKLRQRCDELSDSIIKSETPFLASYTGCSWPCDSVPGIHALATYDRITSEDRYKAVIKHWLAEARDRLDPETGLMPHSASLPDSRTNSVARATSQMIILRLLPDIDPDFARQQYSIFQQRFLSQLVGMPCIREFPSGIEGEGDVDSGPLMMGNSVSATVFMIGLAQIYGDDARADAIAQLAETVGLPWTSGEEKRYVGGILPIGDIMVGYSQNARAWTGNTVHHPDSPVPISRWWRLGIHAISILILLPWLLSRARKRASANRLAAIARS